MVRFIASRQVEDEVVTTSRTSADGGRHRANVTEVGMPSGPDPLVDQARFPISADLRTAASNPASTAVSKPAERIASIAAAVVPR